MNPAVNMTTSIHFGVVEDRDSDPRKLGRCRVRVVGIHTEDKTTLPTADLPWAYPMTPITSAAMNGIGLSPLGPVEGTWCMIVFRDEYKQHPVIIGTVGGIPDEFENLRVEKITDIASSSGVLTTDNGTVVKDSAGEPVKTGTPTEAEAAKAADVKKPSQLSFSGPGDTFLKKQEGLSSLVKGKNKIGTDATPSGTPIYSYQDSGGVWTIGWGNTKMPNGSAVDANSTMTKAEADSLHTASMAAYEATARRAIKVPVTQSMFDAIVSMTYNAGNVNSTQFMSALNAGRYEEAAALIPSTKATVGGVPDAGLKSRREREKTLFLKDGIPNKDASGVTPAPAAPATAEDSRKTENPVVKPADMTDPMSEGSDGSSAFTFITAEGFRDPKGVYPKKAWLKEPDTHRLARNEKISQTIVTVKEAARMTGVPKALGGTWDQPPIPYNAKYPFNHTRVSESGHVEEWDDTKDNERLHTYHTAGTFQEIDKNGTRVTRIVGDDYEILERHGNVLIKGNCSVTIQGTSSIRVENDAKLQILGSAYTEITGDWTVGVGGSVKIHSGGNFSVDAPRIDFNSGGAAGVKIPGETATSADLGTLTNPNRLGEINANYEMPEEGDPAAFHASQIAAGTMTPEDIKPAPTEKKEEVKAEEKPKDTTPPKGCDGITDADLTPNLKLSSSFTLGSLAVGGSGTPQPGSTHYGKPATQIVCNMKKLAENVLDPIKAKYPNMKLTSVWRSEAVNTSAGGSKTSDHLDGSAADIQFTGFSREQTYQAAIEIQKTLPATKQIILEYKGGSTWIHVSYKEGSNSNQALTMDAASNKVIKRDGFVLV